MQQIVSRCRDVLNLSRSGPRIPCYARFSAFALALFAVLVVRLAICGGNYTRNPAPFAQIGCRPCKLNDYDRRNVILNALQQA